MHVHFVDDKNLWDVQRIEHRKKYVCPRTDGTRRVYNMNNNIHIFQRRLRGGIERFGEPITR